MSLPMELPEIAAPAPKPPSLKLGLVLGAVFTLAGFVALPLDVPIAAWLHQHPLRGDLNRLVMLSEFFGYGLTVALILLAAAVLDPRRRGAIWWGALATYWGGLWANLIKLCIARHRPYAVGESLAQMTTVRETFLAVFPPWKLDHSIQSFPSGHSALAAGLAVTLIWLYPRGRWIFPLMAALVAFQRMAAGAHFLSDALFGIAIGVVATTTFLCVAARYQTARATRHAASRPKSVQNVPILAKSE